MKREGRKGGGQKKETRRAESRKERRKRSGEKTNNAGTIGLHCCPLRDEKVLVPNGEGIEVQRLTSSDGIHDREDSKSRNSSA